MLYRDGYMQVSAEGRGEDWMDDIVTYIMGFLERSLSYNQIPKQTILFSVSTAIFPASSFCLFLSA